jgi:Fic family protein
MARYTTRDRLWTFAMKRTHRDGKAITASKLSMMAETSERSARDVLKTMDRNGILREQKRGKTSRYVPEWHDGD